MLIYYISLNYYFLNKTSWTLIQVLFPFKFIKLNMMLIVLKDQTKKYKKFIKQKRKDKILKILQYYPTKKNLLLNKKKTKNNIKNTDKISVSSSNTELQKKINQKDKLMNGFHQDEHHFNVILTIIIFIFLVTIISGVIFAGIQDKFIKPSEKQYSRNYGKETLEYINNENLKISIISQMNNLQIQNLQINHNNQNNLINQNQINQNLQQNNENQRIQKLLETNTNSIIQQKQTLQNEQNLNQTINEENHNIQKVLWRKRENTNVMRQKELQKTLENKFKNKKQDTKSQISNVKKQSQVERQKIIVQPATKIIQKLTDIKVTNSKVINQNKKFSQVNKQINMITCNDYIKNLQTKYGQLYSFNQPIDIFKRNSGANYFVDQVVTKIKSVQYSEAIDLLDLIHKVDQDGNVVVSDTPCEKAQNAIKRLTQLMNQQFKRLNDTYQIDHYNQHQLRFCIVTNSYKNAQSGLIYRNIDSILQQNYTNYHVIYTDDASPDLTEQKVKDYLSLKGQKAMDKIKVKINPQKKGMMENIYNSVTEDCEAGEIVVMLDGDDSFIGVNVLSFLNAVYQRDKVAILWNNFIQINSNQRATMGFSKDYVAYEQIISNRRTARFVSSHLKSFYVDLFRKIKIQDLQQHSGKFYGGASDTAMMNIMIEMASPNKYKYVSEIMYQYRYDTGQVGMIVNRAAQSIALSKIIASEPYKSLDDFGFIDKSIERALKN